MGAGHLVELEVEDNKVNKMKCRQFYGSKVQVKCEDEVGTRMLAMSPHGSGLTRSREVREGSCQALVAHRGLRNPRTEHIAQGFKTSLSPFRFSFLPACLAITLRTQPLSHMMCP